MYLATQPKVAEQYARDLQDGKIATFRADTDNTFFFDQAGGKSREDLAAKLPGGAERYEQLKADFEERYKLALNAARDAGHADPHAAAQQAMGGRIDGGGAALTDMMRGGGYDSLYLYNGDYGDEFVVFEPHKIKLVTVDEPGQEPRSLQHTPAAIRAILDEAGVSEASPKYAETVFRTNAMDSYNQGAQDQLAAEAETFPAWTYSNPHDGRSRPEHAARNGNLYPTSRTFNSVRGTEKKDVMNCRCTIVPVDRWELEEMLAAGETFAE